LAAPLFLGFLLGQQQTHVLLSHPPARLDCQLGLPHSIGIDHALLQHAGGNLEKELVRLACTAARSFCLGAVVFGLLVATRTDSGSVIEWQLPCRALREESL